MFVRKAGRGYSLTMWVMLFAFLITTLAFFFTPLRRALRDKVVGTSNYVIWDQFGTRGLSNIRSSVADINTNKNLKEDAVTTYSGTLPNPSGGGSLTSSETRQETKDYIQTKTDSGTASTSNSTSWR